MRDRTKNIIYLLTPKSLALLVVLLFSGSALCNTLRSKADSIILNVLNNREIYGSYIHEYEAEVYLKGNNYVRKKNFLYQYAPDFLYLDRKGENNFVESIVDIHFKSPNHFIQQVKAINGPKVHSSDIEERVMQFLNLNVYNPTLFNNLVLLPGEKEVFRYYRFEYMESIDTLEYLVHKIRCRPKIRSQKLLDGYLYVLDNYWTILEFDVWGKLDFSRYRVETKFGFPGGDDFLLPKETRITFDMNLLGNKTTNQYYSSYKYRYINKKKEEEDFPETGYDLSKYFSVHLDSLPYIKEENFWKENRTVPLTSYEEELLKKQQIRETKKDTVSVNPGSVINFAQGTIAPKRYQYNNSSFSYSGLVNPLKLAYSRLDGVVYWQQFRFRQIRESGREFRFQPNIGFLFKNKEVYFRVPVNWVFQPGRFGEFNFNFGNKNHTYGYRTQQLIDGEIPDSLNFEDLDLKYFHHYNLMLNGRYEIRNGLMLGGGLDYSWYVPVKSGDSDTPLQAKVEEDVVDIVHNRYRTFSPYIGLTWTPGQYYRFAGKRKEYVSSRYPTLSFEYARGVKGVFNSNSDYERFEIDIQQKIPAGLMRSFQYYIGGGTFTNTRSFYFADFSFFQKRNFPESWDDPIGGVFHLLDGKWYNASASYVQAHFMYEAPFIIFQFFRGITKDILKERFYISQLYTPELPNYTELGYGIGNFIGNIGVFVSLDKGKYDGVGVKFAFELGR